MYRPRNILILIFLIIGVSGSCKNLFRKDLSLTAPQYFGQGMPDHKKTWTQQDFIKAQRTMNDLLVRNFYLLPRKHSRKSSEVFKRIISKDNLSFLEDSAISLRDKAYRMQSIGNFTGVMGTIYTDKLKTQQYYGEELTDIFIFHLYVRNKMLELAEKINKSTSQEEMALQSGRSGIVSSYVLLITFLVNEQEKTQAYSSIELRRLNREILNSITENIKYLDPESKQKINTVIKNSIEKSPSRFTRKNFKKILRLLAE